MQEVRSSNSQLRIALSLSLAFLFHTVLAIIIGKWLLIMPEETVSTVRVQLRNIESVESAFKKPEKASEDNQKDKQGAVREQITSTGESKFDAIDSEPADQNYQPAPSDPSYDSPTRKITAPSFSTIDARPTISSRSGNTFDQVNQIFSQKESSNSKIEQISTKEIKVTPYIERLIQKLAQSQYHDRQYDLRKLPVARSLVIELKLLANGALENVRIIQSSGDNALDKAAKRSAFLSSPFPPPPIEDMKNNYTYELRMLYSPTRDILDK